jgi:hypothetical protein
VKGAQRVETQMSVRARLQVTIEVEAAATWGDKVQADQLYQQARVETLSRLNKLFSEAQFPVRMIGEATVIAVLADIGKPK